MRRAARRRKLRKTGTGNGQAPSGSGPSVAGLYKGVLIGMGFSITIALTVVVSGVVLLVRGEVLEATDRDNVEQLGTAVAENPDEDSPVHISMSVRHLGNLEIEVFAQIALGETNAPLTQANAVFYADMLEMPGRHTRGPITMQQMPNQPGCYTARDQLAMLGSYEIRVVLRQPGPAEERMVIPVGVVSGALLEDPNQICQAGEPSVHDFGPAQDALSTATQVPDIEVQNVEVTMATRNRFDKDEIVVQAGKPIRVRVYNEDSGNVHDWNLIDLSRNAVLAQTPACKDCQESTTFETPLPGEYLFICNFHPSLMRGRFIVLPEGESPPRQEEGDP